MTRTTRLRLVARAAPRLPVGRPRPGVTLIELLVVIAIVGILIALTSAALQKTVERQKVRTSESQVFKLQQALDSEYDRVVQRCAKEAEQHQIPPEVLSVCDNDLARAKAVWTAFQLRLNFPTTFAEAQLSLTIPDSTGTPRFTIKPPATFAAVAGITGDPTRPHEESGALLYLILAQRSVSGGGAMATSADDLTQASRIKATFRVGATANTKEFEVFADAFKNGVGFERWAKFWLPPRMLPAGVNPSGVELQTPPFVDGQKALAGANLDPLDPQNKVFGWQFTGPTDQRRLIQAPQGLDFDGKNRLITVYSLGRTVTNSAGLFTPEDDILGFRLRQQGVKGNKQ